jgi:hypothetical protein
MHIAAMRNPIVVIALLVVLALVPIGGWVAMAASLDPAGLGRSIGKAILVLLAPMAFAGLLMIVGAVMFDRTRRAGRIFATVGASIAGAGSLILAAIWFGRTGRCVDGVNICTADHVVLGLMLAYSIAHFGLIALVWRARRGEMPIAA